MDDKTAANLRASAIEAGKAAAAAGAHASIQALGAAAVNASKSGGSSSEFKGTILAILLTGGVAALHALSVIPGPWTVPAVALSAAIAAGSYAISRGNVKAAALAGAAAAAGAIAPNQAAAIQAGAAIAGAALGITPAPPP